MSQPLAMAFAQGTVSVERTQTQLQVTDRLIKPVALQTIEYV